MLEAFASNCRNSVSERMLAGLLDGIRDAPLQSESNSDSQRIEEETKAIFLPSQERINQMCRGFRRYWSDREFHKRSHSQPVRWMVPGATAPLNPRKVIGD